MSTSFVEAVKGAARGRWPEILSVVGGIPLESLDGRHGPCPKCGGVDRFRLINVDFGACLCNQCLTTKNGDGLAAIQWYRGWSFHDALQAVADFLGVKIRQSKKTTAGGQESIGVYASPRDAIRACLPALLASTGKRWAAAGVPWPAKPDQPKPVKAWHYSTFSVIRIDLPTPPGQKRWKEFRPLHQVALHDGRQAWSWGYPPGPRPLYLLPQLLAASETTLAVVVGGEKAADAAVELGLVATTCAGGEKAVAHTDWAPLVKFRQVVVSIDNDPAGEEFGWAVAATLKQLRSEMVVKILRLPDLPPKGDIVEWIAAGGTLEKFLGLAARAAEITGEQIEQWKKGRKKQSPSKISNATFVADEHGEEVPVPKPMVDTIVSILEATEGWPRKAGGAMFIDAVDEIQWLNSPAAFFGWLSNLVGVVPWYRGPGFVTKEEIYHEVRRTTQEYLAVEPLPHEPAVAGHYYMQKGLEPGDGAMLSSLLDCFSLETPHDRSLLTCALATPLWGGPPGARPAIMFTAAKGRGRGKSTLASLVAQLYGGAIDISAGEDVANVKKRLLSPAAACRRIALIDNVKTTRFSWAELEALITAREISGHRMYAGEASRPNLLTWLITLNGASLSTDLAQRVVEIHLGEPSYEGGWEERVKRLIAEKQLAIVADLIAFLRRPLVQLPRLTRWAAWESQVLARVQDPVKCLEVVVERRAAADVEQEESEIVEDFFASKLRSLGYDTDTVDVFIPNDLAAAWFNQATGDSRKVAGVARTLKQLKDEGKLQQIVPARCGTSGNRGVRWVGWHCDASARIAMDLRHRVATMFDQRQTREFTEARAITSEAF